MPARSVYSEKMGDALMLAATAATAFVPVEAAAISVATKITSRARSLFTSIRASRAADELAETVAKRRIELNISRDEVRDPFAIHPSPSVPKGSFNQLVRDGLSPLGQANVRTLQQWAQKQGWTLRSDRVKPNQVEGDGFSSLIQEWGFVDKSSGKFVFTLKIKAPGVSTGLADGSKVWRFSARVPESGGFKSVNPFTGQTGTPKSTLTLSNGETTNLGHLPIDYKW
jgi:hypothetical protein